MKTIIDRRNYDNKALKKKERAFETLFNPLEWFCSLKDYKKYLKKFHNPIKRFHQDYDLGEPRKKRIEKIRKEEQLKELF